MSDYAPKQRGGGDKGPTRPGHLGNRSASTSRGGQPSKSMKTPKGSGDTNRSGRVTYKKGNGKPKKGCPPLLLLVLGLTTATVFQGSYVAYSVLSLVV